MDVADAVRFFHHATAQEICRRPAAPKNRADREFVFQPARVCKIDNLSPIHRASEMRARDLPVVLATTATDLGDCNHVHIRSGRSFTDRNEIVAAALFAVLDRTSPAALARTRTSSASGSRRIRPAVAAADNPAALEFETAFPKSGRSPVLRGLGKRIRRSASHEREVAYSSRNLE